jgi:hypothetical protein
MASEVANMNGNYAQSQSQGQDQNHNSHNGTNGDYSAATNGSTNEHAVQNTETIPKDEVGWYFVEQYYTTISKNPDKLYVRTCKDRFEKQFADVKLAFLQQEITIRIWY